MPYSQSDPFRSIRGNIIRAGAPVTVSIIATCVVLFLLDFFSQGAIARLLACSVVDSHIAPLWSPITYPLINPSFIGIVFASLWLWWLGGSLERSWGSQRYGLFAAGVALLTVLCVWLGCSILHLFFLLIGLWIPLSAVTVAWATINPRQTIMLYGVLPIQAMWIAWFEVGIVYFVYYGANPILGLFGILPCAAAFYYVRSGMSSGYPYRGYAGGGPDLRIVTPRAQRSIDGSRGGFNPMSWYRDWKERRRLRKLWRDSGFSDRDFKG